MKFEQATRNVSESLWVIKVRLALAHVLAIFSEEF